MGTPVNPIYQVSRWAQSVVDLLLPPRCAGCQKVGEVVCASCRRELVWVAEPICPQCGQTGEARGVCGRCRGQSWPLQIRAALLFRGSLPPIIHQFKYHKMFGLAGQLADLMVQAWPQWVLPVDVVVPIPLHKERLKMRGYNQSALLAYHLAAQWGVPLRPQALARHRPTEVQARLKAHERLANVQGAFTAVAKHVHGRQVLLVDDVCTTGATLQAAAHALLEAGATAVNAYCLARA